MPNFKGAFSLHFGPFSGGQNTRGGRNLRFSTEITVYRGNGTSMSMVAMERYVSIPTTLKAGRKGQIFQVDLLNNARIPFDLERPNSAG